MSFNAMFKECTRQHALAHSVSGAGIALFGFAFRSKFG